MVILKGKFFTIADVNKQKVFEIRNIIKSSGMMNVTIVNLLCLNNYSTELGKLLKNKDSRVKKFFYGCGEGVFNNMLNSFNLLDRRDVFYIGKNFELSSMVIQYHTG